MRQSLLCLLLLTLAAHAAEPNYPRDVTKWQEIVPPARSDKQARQDWFMEANWTFPAWRVFVDGASISAEISESEVPVQQHRPPFEAAADDFRAASRFWPVDDGWLVGFNHGEFGAALYWFSRDGKRHYEISRHHVVTFFALADGIHAIEGLAHGDMSKGSVISISRTQRDGHWRAFTVAALPFAPYAVSVKRDGTLLVTVSDGVVAIGSDRRVNTIYSERMWNGLYPISSVLSGDERRLYIGMRRYVVELDLQAKAVRYLLPTKAVARAFARPSSPRSARRCARPVGTSCMAAVATRSSRCMNASPLAGRRIPAMCRRKPSRYSRTWRASRPAKLCGASQSGS